MLSDSLVTNEIKNYSGVEVEFNRWTIGPTSTIFRASTANPSAWTEMIISHQESGKGLDRVRRSMLRFNYPAVGMVDSTKTCMSSFHLVGTIPIGQLTDLNYAKMPLAMLLSFAATTGAGTTVLFDGTGNGAKALLEGSL
jgi:hypothetical protein